MAEGKRLLYNRLCILGVISMVGAVLTADPAAALTIVDDGKAVATIVVPENPPWWTVQKGANWLQSYVRKATGVELPIVAEDKAPADGVRISIGHTKLAEQAGITTDDLKLDSCKLIVKGDVLFLIGRDGAEAEKHKTPRGSCRAVVTFLEEFVGVRWLIPSWNNDFPQGEHVPDTETIRVADDLEKTIISRNAFVHAESYYNTAGPAHIANNSNTKIKYWTVGGHSWEIFVPKEKYYKDHPEYFALINGKRADSRASFLCTSNPEVRQIMVREIRKLFDEGYDWVQLGQTDGMTYGNGTCQCTECEKLDTFSEMGNSNFPLERLQEHPPERILLAHKWIADECRKSHPDKTIHLLLYQLSRMPSKLFDSYGDNVVAENAIGSYDGFKQVTESWRGKVRAFTSYSYWEAISVTPLGILPKITPKSVSRQMKYYDENNVIGIYYCVGTFGKNWGLWGPVYYMVGRLTGDPDRNPDLLMKEYCDGVYGETGPIMGEFFDHLYSRIDKIGEMHTDGLETKDHFLLYYPPHFVKQLDKMLRRAEQAAETEKSKGWVRLTRDCFDYIRTVSNVITLEKAYEANPTLANLKQVKESVDAFQDYRAHILSYVDNRDFQLNWFPSYSMLSRFLMSDDSQLYSENDPSRPTAYGLIGAPLTWDFEKKLANFGQSTEKRILVQRTTGPATPDGRLDPAEWDKVEPQALDEVSGGKPEVSTMVRALYDDDNLYVSYVCEEPEMDEFAIKITGRDNDIWHADCAEVMLSPKKSFKTFIHFIVAPREGSFYDARTSETTDILDPAYGKEDTRWDPDWDYSFSVDKANKRWTVEMRFPFTSLGVPSPGVGTTWTANFGRERHTGRRADYLWSPSDNGSFSQLATYGELEFGK